jgi:polar amino acid transport system ATP-binding protein
MFLDRGKIAQQGTPANVLENPESDGLQTFLERFRASHI